MIPSIFPAVAVILALATIGATIDPQRLLAEEPSNHQDVHGDRPEDLNGQLGLVKNRPTTGRYLETPAGFMVPYTMAIPGTDVTIEMVPIPGSTLELELPRVDHSDDQSASAQTAVCRVQIEPYWIGRYEVTWAQYWPFMQLNDVYSQVEQLRSLLATAPEAWAARMSGSRLQEAIDVELNLVDGITAPTSLYDSSTAYFSGEEPDLPAVSMTPYAARQYTKWLSSISGLEFRLPSEIEWEHAAAAGEPGPPSAEVEDLDAKAWHADNSDYAAHAVGLKEPNPWGVYDMLGNVAEWVLDSANVESFRYPSEQVLSWETATCWPKQVSTRIAKGGWWDSSPEEVTVTSRVVSEDEDWKMTDPNRPKSPWWYTDEPSYGVGFRVLRPLYRMSTEQRHRVWEIDAPELQTDVEFRLKEGRGKLGPIGPQLPKLIEQLESDEVKSMLDGN